MCINSSKVFHTMHSPPAPRSLIFWQRWPLLGFSALLSSCASFAAPARPLLPENSCIIKSERKDREPENWGATALVYNGNSYLELATRSELNEYKLELVKYAETCYQLANNLNKYDYSSELGLGVSSLMLGLLRDNYYDGYFKIYLGAAKQHLGRAFILSQAHLEPLYYLAEIAKLEGDDNRANSMIRPLVAREYKGQFSKKLFFETQKKR